jgi:large subunit ribosomal protein L37Ae
MAEKQFGSIKRFGARYGRTVKYNLAKIEKLIKHLQKCPYCLALKAKRVSAGIWHCKKCDAKFAGKAYTVGGKLKASDTNIAPQELEEQKPRRKSKKTDSEEIDDEV